MNDKEKAQLLLLTMMTQAFGLFSDAAAELMEKEDELEFEKDPYNKTMDLMKKAFSVFESEFANIISEQNEPIKLIELTEDIFDELSSELGIELDMPSKPAKKEGLH
jgi:hypothetical protein